MARPSPYRFTAPLDVRHSDPSGRTKTVLTAFAFEGPGISVAVPAGFVTDFASIPRALWWLYPPDGPWCQASVVHDVLYRTQPCERVVADALFLQAMAVSRVPAHRRWIMYLALRLAGGVAWKANQRRRK